MASLQYILKEPIGDETTTSHSSVVDRLLSTIGAWLIKEEPAIYVYDGGWTRSTKLWDEVKKAKWEDVILNPKMKKALTEVANKFFDNEDIYKEYGVPWKRGLIFHGPVGMSTTQIELGQWPAYELCELTVPRKRQDDFIESTDAHSPGTKTARSHPICQIRTVLVDA